VTTQPTSANRLTVPMVHDLRRRAEREPAIRVTVHQHPARAMGEL